MGFSIRFNNKNTKGTTLRQDYDRVVMRATGIIGKCFPAIMEETAGGADEELIDLLNETMDMVQDAMSFSDKYLDSYIQMTETIKTLDERTVEIMKQNEELMKKLDSMQRASSKKAAAE